MNLGTSYFTSVFEITKFLCLLAEEKYVLLTIISCIKDSDKMRLILLRPVTISQHFFSFDLTLNTVTV
jgi:hypothetical protein